MTTVLYLFSTVVIVFVLASLWFASYTYKRAKDLAPYYAEKETLAQDIATAKQNYAQTKLEIEKLEAQLAQAKEVIAQAVEKKKFLDENVGTVASLQVDISRTKTELDSVNDLYNKAVEKLQTSNEELQKSQTELSSCQWLCKNLENEKTNLESQLHSLNSKKETTEQAIVAKESELKKIVNNIAKIELDLAAKNKELEKVENKLKEIKEDIAKQKSERETQLMAFEKKKSVIEDEIERLNSTRNDVRTKVSQLEYELSGLSGKEIALEKKWEDLDRAIKTINITNPKRFSENEWLAEFESNLKNCNFKFDSRLVRAFHTSLKVADCSPLVVLAGISGTGKSLLPELYAHAIGMNFLQVPVQPRWDSPQDMLGFYNYMEGRYKATELSRLLWQSDYYNNRERAKLNPAMNLILLDEMNLARVEYYFSDMLSKLEVRRGINPDNKAKRMSAEIVLESGATGGKDDIRRIFVGNNNLFIGTMNEDESTQSLSDKVKDRANVLRFARPKSLSGVVADKERFFKMFENRMMPHKHWESWRSSSNTVFFDLSQRMEEINKHMAALGRPFAHRMWNTVNSYITQYPGNKHEAWVDQIEMKILPKLAGLDMSEPAIAAHMNDLGAVLNDLNDDKLIAAFRLAQSRDFFAWQGVER